MKPIQTSRLLRKILSTIYQIVDCRQFAPPSGISVDIVIPVTTKDLPVLPLALEGIRTCVTHPVDTIYIVAPYDEGIIRFCQNNKVEFVDECSVLGFGPKELGLMAGNPPRNRSGWIFQQLLKLSGTIGNQENFVTIDADHILLRPHTFIASDGVPVVYRSKEYHKPYYDNIERLIGYRPKSWLSYVAHKMVFNRKELARLHSAIEAYNPGKTWVEAILDSLDRNELSGFSEYELYGSFIRNKHSLPFGNHHLGKKRLMSYSALARRYGPIYRSITFPDYIND